MRLWVDFNDIEGDGLVAAVMDGRAPEVGERAILTDHEGNRCEGVVSSVQQGLVYVDPDWSTWTTREDRQILPQGWVADSGKYVTTGSFWRATKGSVGVRMSSPNFDVNSGDAPIRTGLPRRRQVA